jgi:hypothetical protein
MTKALPREINQVQAFMEQARKEMQSAEIERIVNPTLAVVDDFGYLNFSQSEVSAVYPHGKTVRRGWISSGKQIALAGSEH